MDRLDLHKPLSYIRRVRLIDCRFILYTRVKRSIKRGDEATRRGSPVSRQSLSSTRARVHALR